jgi:hypothetical protein
VEVQERPRSPRELTAPALAQLGEPAQFHQQCLQAVKTLLRCMPHEPSITLEVKATQELTFPGRVSDGPDGRARYRFMPQPRPQPIMINLG